MADWLTWIRCALINPLNTILTDHDDSRIQFDTIILWVTEDVDDIWQYIRQNNYNLRLILTQLYPELSACQLGQSS